MTAHEIAAQLSPEAKSALVAAGCSRQGATVPVTSDPKIAGQLISYGLIGKANGLTARGTVVRTIVAEQMLEEAFG